MQTEIAIPVAGEMGAGIGRVLTGQGARVLTCLDGRSAATRARAGAAGMIDVSPGELAAAPVILSVVPPAVAVETARRLAAQVPTGSRPLYLDLNAINPERAQLVGRIAAGAGCAFVDGGIIGPPPSPGQAGTVIYLSGENAPAAIWLRDLGLDIRVIDGGVGAASALKMCYGALTKGATGLSAAIFAAAERAGVGAAFHAELERSRAAFLAQSAAGVPSMYPKAYRWVDEMRQIGGFLGEDRPEAVIWTALGDFYEALAADLAEGRETVEAIDRFLARPSSED